MNVWQGPKYTSVNNKKEQDFKICMSIEIQSNLWWKDLKFDQALILIFFSQVKINQLS